VAAPTSTARREIDMQPNASKGSWVQHGYFSEGAQAAQVFRQRG